MSLRVKFMLKNGTSLLLPPHGRLSRCPFWIALIGVSLLVAGVNVILQQLDNNMTAFWIMIDRDAPSV